MSEKLTIEQNLSLLLETKTKMKENIIASGGTINDDTPFIEYVKYVSGSSEGGSSNNIIEVNEFPTENVQEDKIYKLNEISDIDVFMLTTDNYEPGNLYQAIKDLGVVPNITYYLVEELPSNPQSSDLATFSQVYVYIYEDIPYIYGNAGYGDMWLKFSDLISSMLGDTFENKGFVRGKNYISEKGVYVTYKKNVYGLNLGEKDNVYTYKDTWKDYKKIFERSILEFTDYEIKLLSDYSFANCYELKSVNTPNIKNIGNYCFNNCSSLTNVNMPNLVVIFNNAFDNCRKLQSIDFPLVERISDSAFYSCESIKTANFPNVILIEGNAFAFCEALESANFPLVEACYTRAFANCQNLKNVNVPKLKQLNDYAFNDCSGLEYINLPCLSDISTNTFEGCTSLKKVDLGNVIRIRHNAFLHCENLTTLIIRTTSGVCTLEYVYNNNLRMPFEGTPFINGEGTLYVPDNLVSDYKANTYWRTNLPNYNTQIKPLSEYVE